MNGGGARGAAVGSGWRMASQARNVNPRVNAAAPTMVADRPATPMLIVNRNGSTIWCSRNSDWYCPSRSARSSPVSGLTCHILARHCPVDARPTAIMSNATTKPATLCVTAISNSPPAATTPEPVMDQVPRISRSPARPEPAVIPIVL
ncbi:hypothetical protein GCM10023321_73400 [Pseudonocardia eucalypti]|uniref:Uncharacterized protein n=1 Tax=Pseudonocardia eucalypti TaxID=648755 RepID=A0ABP9R839_9PSEU